MDTRSPGTIGPRATPLGTDTTHTVQVTGRNGNCALPTDVASVVMNVTAVNPGQAGFVTVFPAGTSRPNASNLNYTAGQAPTPNQVTVGVSEDGKVSFFAKFGPVDLVADVVGYFTRSRLSTSQLVQQRWDRDRGRAFSSNRFQLIFAMAFDGSRVWATRNEIGSVAPLDTLTGEFGTAVATGGQPVALAFDGSLLWVANGSSNTVSRVDPATGTKVGADLTGFNTPFGLVFDGTSMWVANLGGGTVTKVDAATFTKGPDLPVGASPRSMVFDGTRVWVGTSTAVSRINVSTATVEPVNVATGGAPGGLAFDGSNVWVTVPSLNTVARFSASTAARTGSLITSVTSPADIVFDGDEMWIGSSTAATLTRVNAVTGESRPTLTVPSSVDTLAFDGTSVWAAFNNSTLQRFRTG